MEPSFSPLVLVIDDEPGLRDMLHYGLVRRGYRVACAADGQEGLAKMREEPADLVICDVMMPGPNGLEVLSRIKEISPAAQVIMTTGFATLETAVQAMKTGAFDFVTKPYGLPQLCAVLEKALEWRALRAKVDHLEELHRLKDQFIATVSHELRTPITVILGYAALMREGASHGQDPQNVLEVIESKAKGLLRIINNIIDLANLSAQREPLVLEAFPIADIAKETYDALRPLGEAKGVAMSLTIAPNLLIETDRTKLKQVLTHLLDNAIKFTSSGTISLEIEPADARQVRFRVRDTGIGIDREHIPLIFQEFRQVDQTNTRKHTGTGLGLAVCKKFVELLGGTIDVESVPDQGSTFTVILPGRRTAGDTTSPPVLAPAIRASNGPRVLLVADDDPAFARLFQNLLAREGYSVSTALGGEEALEKMTRHRPDALLLDLVMPDLTGFEVLEAMMQQPALAEVKVIIVTSKDLTGAEKAQLMKRADMIIQKGAKDLPEILDAINQSLRRTP